MIATIWLWRGFHFALTLAMPIVFVLLTGCIKAKPEPEDLGPAVHEDKVFDAIFKAMNGATLNETRVDQYSYYVITQRIENEEGVFNLGTNFVKVKAEQQNDTGTETKYFLDIVKTRRTNSGGWEEERSESSFKVSKILDVLSLTNSEFRALADEPAKPGPDRVTFHRLKTGSGVIDPPAAVKNRPGCGGLNPCAIPARYVQFKLVEWYKNGTHESFGFDLAFSTKTPWLPYGDSIFDQTNGALVMNCQSRYIPVSDRKVYVRVCFHLEDFQK